MKEEPCLLWSSTQYVRRLVHNMTRWTPEQYADHLAKQDAPKKAKYGNTKTTVDSITFDSKREASRWQELKLLEAAGRISNLRRQVPYVLAPSVVLDGRRKPALRYFADYVYVEDGKEVVEDVKSEITRKKDSYRIKRHLMATVLGIYIIEV